MAEDWSRDEVEAIVGDYFAMLRAELAGEVYSKTAHRRALAPLLSGRSDGSIEFKHANISAVLLGYPTRPAKRLHCGQQSGRGSRFHDLEWWMVINLVAGCDQLVSPSPP